MTCTERIAELVEYARQQSKPDRELRAHLSVCAGCKERWDRERQLTAEFVSIRSRTGALRSPDARREALMKDFSRQRQVHLVAGRRHAWAGSWVWTLAAAAALFFVVFAGHEAGLRNRERAHPTRTNRVQTADALLYEASDWLNNDGLSSDASALSSDDFVAIPYTPPLAPGEMVRMVGATMYPETLAGMGVAVDPSWTGDLPVDLVVGEDGLPRAVRIAENGQF